MLELAKAGEITGAASVVIFRGREFMTIALGEAKRNPVFARGMVSVLDDHLAEKTRS